MTDKVAEYLKLLAKNLDAADGNSADGIHVEAAKKYLAEELDIAKKSGNKSEQQALQIFSQLMNNVTGTFHITDEQIDTGLKNLRDRVTTGEVAKLLNEQGADADLAIQNLKNHKPKEIGVTI